SAEKRYVVDGLEIEAGDYAVLGDVLPELRPAWIDHGYGNTLGSLVNGGGIVALSCGGTEIDRMAYPAAEGANGGATRILGGRRVPDHLADDAAANLCVSAAASGVAAGVVGSPGEANEVCAVVVPGTCLEDGAPRPVESPQPGDLIISEIMA